MADNSLSVRKRAVPPSMVERITLIMDAFDSRASMLTLEQVTVRTHLPRSTAHRILDQLVHGAWLEHTQAGYCLGPRALAFGGQDGTHGEIRAAAASTIQELLLRTGLVVHLAVLDDADVVYLDKLGGPFATTLPSRVGGRVPAHTTAVGKAMLACLPPERVDELFEGKLVRRTDRSIGDLLLLHNELSRIRTRSGLAYDKEESVRGVVCVAAPIRGQRGVAAGISLCGDAHATRLERAAPLVLDAAREISRRLFPELARPQRVRSTGARHSEIRVVSPKPSTWPALAASG